MFDVDRVSVALRTLKLKIETDRDDDDERRVRRCECTFRVPLLSYDLAAKVRLPIVQHCFGRDHLPLWGVHEVAFAAPDEHFTATLQPVPDAPPTATLELVKLAQVRVWRPKEDRRDLALEFITRHELARGDARDLADLINAWEGGLTLITLTAVQMPLELPPEDGDEPAAGPRPVPTKRGGRGTTH